MRRDADVVVVGAGIAGLAAAHALARRGREVLVLEQFRLGHARGSSHGATRIFRLAYPDAEWVRLAQEALEGWRALEAESGSELVALSGLVELVRDLAESSEAALASCGVECRVIEATEAESEFGLRVPDGFTALLQPHGGVVYAERAHAAFAVGLAVREGVRVEAIAQEDDAVRLATSDGPVSAGAAVIAAGPWARPLLATASIPLPVVPTRETVAYFAFSPPRLPPAVAEFQTEARRHAFYALHDPRYGLKAGLNGSGCPTDPELDEPPDPLIVARVAEWVGTRFALDAREPEYAETCLYTNTADERFVLERRGRVVVGSACSGHGFKFAPVVGRRLGQLAVEALG